jgi:hypothetical protein
MKYYLVIIRNELLIHATTQISLECIMLSERSQKKKLHFVWLYSYDMSKIGKSIETENDILKKVNFVTSTLYLKITVINN